MKYLFVNLWLWNFKVEEKWHWTYAWLSTWPGPGHLLSSAVMIFILSIALFVVRVLHISPVIPAIVNGIIYILFLFFLNPKYQTEAMSKFEKLTNSKATTISAVVYAVGGTAMFSILLLLSAGIHILVFRT